jgi:hypothetical protein
MDIKMFQLIEGAGRKIRDYLKNHECAEKFVMLAWIDFPKGILKYV